MPKPTIDNKNAAEIVSTLQAIARAAERAAAEDPTMWDAIAADLLVQSERIDEELVQPMRAAEGLGKRYRRR